MKQLIEPDIRKKAEALCAGGSVEISGYLVRLHEVHINIECSYCPLFSQCDWDMNTICALCDVLTGKHCQLELE